jgi:hypothetical protein
MFFSPKEKLDIPTKDVRRFQIFATLIMDLIWLQEIN